MSKLHLEIEDMRVRLTEAARNEQTLLRALSEALNQVDQQLLTEVRKVTSEHEARRGQILGELQVLATRLCTFQAPEALPPAHEPPAQIGMRPHAPGNWRLAASQVEDEYDALGPHLN